MNTSIARRLAVVVCTVSLGAGCWGARKDKASTPPEAQSAPPAEESAPAEPAIEPPPVVVAKAPPPPSVDPFPAETPCLTQSGVLSHLPGSTAAVVAFSGLAPWLTRLAWEKMKAHKSGFHARLAQYTSEKFGLDLSSPSALAAIGVSTTAPMALAAWDHEGLIVAAYLPLEDKARFSKWVVPGSGDKNGAIRSLVRGQWAIVVMGRQATAAAAELAALTAEQSLAGRADVAKTLSELAFGAQLSAFVDIDAITSPWSHRYWPARVKPLFDAIPRTGTHLALGGQVADEGFFVKGALSLPENGLLRRLLPASGPAPLTHAADGLPAVLTHVGLDVKTGLALLGRFVGPAQFEAELRSLKLQSAILEKLLTGELVVVGGNHDPVSVRVGITDEARVTALWTRALKSYWGDPKQDGNGAWDLGFLSVRIGGGLRYCHI